MYRCTELVKLVALDDSPTWKTLYNLVADLYFSRFTTVLYYTKRFIAFYLSCQNIQ